MDSFTYGMTGNTKGIMWDATGVTSVTDIFVVPDG